MVKKIIAARLDKRSYNIDSGWKTNAASVAFNNHTLEDFQEQRQELAATRLQLKNAEQLVKSLRQTVATKEVSLWELCGAIVDAVIGNPAFGRASQLYASFGLIPPAQRKSGLTKKHKIVADEPAQELAQSAQKVVQAAIEKPLALSNGYANGHG